MSHRPRCTECGRGLTARTRYIGTPEDRLILAIFNLAVCGGCAGIVLERLTRRHA